MNDITTGTVTMSIMSNKGAVPFKNPNDVDFNVKYPEGYQGKKTMPEGIVTISKESAEHFEKLGIGSVVGEEKKSEETTTSNEPEKLKAAEVIAKISEATSIEAIDALVKDDTRKTVIEAADTKRKQLSESQQS